MTAVQRQPVENPSDEAWREVTWREGVGERAALATQLENLADSIATWGANADEDGQVVRRLRRLSTLVRHPEGVSVERWTEVRLTGQPPHPTDPPYDFTFRSNTGAWEFKSALLDRALASWSDVVIEQRQVERQVRTTEWAVLPATDRAVDGADTEETP